MEKTFINILGSLSFFYKAVVLLKFLLKLSCFIKALIKVKLLLKLSCLKLSCLNW